MGRHRKPSRILTGTTAGAAAAPTLAGLAAALCMTQAPSANAATQPVIHAITALRPADPAARTQAPGEYTVRPGDTLSAIAAADYGDAGWWPQIYAENRAAIGPDPNFIQAGERLTLGAQYPSRPSAPVQAAPANPPPAGTYGHPYYCGDGDGDGFDMPCWKLHHTAPQAPAAAVPAPADPPAPAQAQAPAQAPAPAAVTYTGSGSFQQCVIARESGGNPQIMNTTGHYGLYQFAEGTWTAAGGNPADFGHATVAEQNQVFAAAYARWGTQPWGPSDGC